MIMYCKNSWLLRKLLLCTLFLVFYSISTFSQIAGIRHYTISDGIAGMNTYMCFQDSKGYIWIATSEGVSRFDGTTFTNFTRKEGLPDNDILRIYEDPYQRIWFLSFNGHLSFYSLKDNTIHNASTDNFIKNLYVGAGFENMFVDSKNRIWFSSLGNKLALLDVEQVQQIDLSDLITRDCISVSEDNENNIIIYSGFNKLKFDNSKNTFVIKDSTIEGSVTTFFGYKPGIDCFANQKTIGRIERGEIIPLLDFSETDIKNDTYITSTLHDSLLIISTTNSGVHVYELMPNKRKVYQFSVECNVISSILDKENNLWVATRNNGVYMLSQSFRSGIYYNPQIFDNKTILTICKIGPTGFLVGGTDNSLFLLENQKIRKINFRLKDNADIRSIIDIYLDPLQNIWLSCDYGVLKTSVQDIENSDAMSGVLFDKISKYKFNSIQINSDGNGVASTSQKLYRIKIDKHSKAQIFIDSTFAATGIRILQSF